MHFLCECGNRIHDITDNLSYKAHLISDQDWFDFLDKIDDVVEKSGPSQKDKENALMQISSLAVNMTKLVYLCKKCGNIFFDDDNGGLLEMYKPCSENVNTKLLESYKKEKWQGSLSAEWVDEKPEWLESNGFISQDTNYKSHKISQNNGYDNWDNLEKEYYIIFEELREEGVLRSSSLKKNKILIHSWNIKNE